MRWSIPFAGIEPAVALASGFCTEAYECQNPRCDHNSDFRQFKGGCLTMIRGSVFFVIFFLVSTANAQMQLPPSQKEIDISERHMPEEWAPYKRSHERDLAMFLPPEKDAFQQQVQEFVCKLPGINEATLKSAREYIYSQLIKEKSAMDPSIFMEFEKTEKAAFEENCQKKLASVYLYYMAVLFNKK